MVILLGQPDEIMMKDDLLFKSVDQRYKKNQKNKFYIWVVKDCHFSKKLSKIFLAKINIIFVLKIFDF